MDFKKIDEARKILDLGENATLEEIRLAYRQLALYHHPDRSKDTDKKRSSETFQKITVAYHILLAYCENYRYSFKKRDVTKMIDKEVDDNYLKNFYDSWIIDYEKEEKK